MKKIMTAFSITITAKQILNLISPYLPALFSRRPSSLKSLSWSLVLKKYKKSKKRLPSGSKKQVAMFIIKLIILSL